MKAQVITRFGDPEVFTEMELPKPTPLAGQVLIKVAATSINPVDYVIRNGSWTAVAPAFPAVLHGDVAGIIEEVGDGVTAFKPGDEVYACAGGLVNTGGALAEYMAADALLVAKKPRNLSMAEAAALPLVTITAWEGLIDRAKIKPGQKVLVHAATGGVGHIGIQLAKWAGAEVYATGSSAEKLEIARQLGAATGINYLELSVAEYVTKYTGGKGFEVVLDTIGGKNLSNSLQAAANNGTVVCISSGSTQDLSPMGYKALTLHSVFMLLPMLTGAGKARHGQILTEVAKLVEEGQLRPLLDPRIFKFSEVSAAHQHAQSGKQIGKVVLVQD